MHIYGRDKSGTVKVFNLFDTSMSTHFRINKWQFRLSAFYLMPHNILKADLMDWLCHKLELKRTQWNGENSSSTNLIAEINIDTFRGSHL